MDDEIFGKHIPVTYVLGKFEPTPQRPTYQQFVNGEQPCPVCGKFKGECGCNPFNVWDWNELD